MTGAIRGGLGRWAVILGNSDAGTVAAVPASGVGPVDGGASRAVKGTLRVVGGGQRARCRGCGSYGFVWETVTRFGRELVRRSVCNGCLLVVAREAA